MRDADAHMDRLLASGNVPPDVALHMRRLWANETARLHCELVVTAPAAADEASGFEATVDAHHQCCLELLASIPLHDTPGLSPRTVIYTFHTTTRSAARELAERLAWCGYQASTRRVGWIAASWRIEARAKRSLQGAEGRRTIRQLMFLAARSKTEYRGCQIVA